MNNIFYVRICFAHGIHDSFYCNETIKDEIVNKLQSGDATIWTIVFGDDSILVINPEYVCLADIKPSYNSDVRIFDEVKQFGASRTN